MVTFWGSLPFQFLLVFFDDPGLLCSLWSFFTLKTNHSGVGHCLLWRAWFLRNQRFSMARVTKSWNGWISFARIFMRWARLRTILIQFEIGWLAKVEMLISHWDCLHKILEKEWLRKRWVRFSSSVLQRGKGFDLLEWWVLLFRWVIWSEEYYALFFRARVLVYLAFWVFKFFSRF